MLTLYKPHSRSKNDSDSSVERIIPAGRPYLTKVNGQLVMAREKRNKAADIAVDLLGEAFGVNTRVIRKRSKSVDRPKEPLLIGGVPYVPQQQLTYTAPLLQQAFPSQSLVPYPARQASSFVLLNPTQRDFDQLQQINSHFNKMVGHEAPSHTNHAKEEVTQTTITITKHICAGCGRIRSKKYHQNHPLKEGDKPAPDFCRKCQKDSSSTSSGGSRRERKKNGKKARHKKHHKKHTERSSDDESSVSSGKKTHTKPKHHPAKRAPRRIPSEEYIIVEEDFSEEELRRPRSRGRARQRVIVDEYEFERRPLSPLSSQSSRTRPRSTSRKETFEIQRKPVRPPKVRETIIRESVERSPPIEYGVVEGVPASRVIEERVNTYPRKIPVHFYDEHVHELAPPANQYYREQDGLKRESFGKQYNIGEAETVRRGAPSREYFEERETVSSSRSQEARQRRRRERNSPVSPVVPLWETPHILRPRNNDDVIVVTERFEYRPKKHAHSEEDRRRQEYVDRATLDAHARTNQFSADEAARYYHEDWSRVEPEPVPEPPRRIEQSEPSYRRDRHRDTELSDSETSYEYRRIGRKNLPRGPSPPSRIYDSAKVETWQDRTPYPLSSDSEAGQDLNNTRKGKAGKRLPPIEIPQQRGRSTSRARSAHAREATDGGTEKALIPSPRHSREREQVRYVEDISVSDMTERERIAEGETRHVTFRDTPSIRSVHESWVENSESWPVEAERSGSGWNQ